MHLEWNAKNKTSGKIQAKFSLYFEEAPLWKQQAADVVRRVSVFPGEPQAARPPFTVVTPK